jgi:hypothetical protein
MICSGSWSETGSSGDFRAGSDPDPGLDPAPQRWSNKQVREYSGTRIKLLRRMGDGRGKGGRRRKRQISINGHYLLIDNIVALKKADWYSGWVVSITTDRRSSRPLLSRSGKPDLWAGAKHVLLGQ